ncbi:MAG TPA: PAS domain S-box protein [Acidimicrobiales bacterium]|nr:PAS domain S-box protein [Acidimicrobiales bacterium]
MVDLAVALPGTGIVVAAEDPELRAEALARGCVGACSFAELAGEEGGERVASALAARDLHDQWGARFAQMRTLFGSLDLGIVVISPTGRVVVANLLANELVGTPRADLLYRRDPDLGLKTLAGNEVTPEERIVEQVLATGRPSEPAQRVVRLPNGGDRILEVRAAPVAAPAGPGAMAVVITGRDVTEQLTVQRALLSAERRDSLLLEHAAEGYLVLDEHGHVTEASPTLNRYYPAEWLLGIDARLLLHAEERERAAAMFAAVRERAGVPVRAELRFVDRDGEERWAELTMTNRLAEASIGGIVLNLRDITERKLAEQSMAQLSAIVEFSEDAIIAETLDGTITAWNPASARLYGYSAAEAIGRLSMELIVPSARRAELQEIWDRIRRGEHVERRDSLRVRKDGTRVVVSLHVSPVFNANGQLVGTSTIARDVSERRRLEEERSMFEERFRIGFEQGAIGMAMLDLRRRFTRVNKALCTMLGRTEEELIGHVVETFVHPFEIELAIQASSAQVVGGVDHFHGERRYLRKDGTDVWATVDSTVVRQPDGSPIYVFSQLQDITDRKRSEQALAHQALHDALTGLPNRALLGDRLGQAIDRGHRNVTQVALLFLDLDRFKLVNDGLGHAAGDRLLVDIGERLVGSLRRSDTVARFGGDEFIVMREDVDATEAVDLGDKVIGLFQEAFVLDGVELHVSTSCGVVLVTGDTTVDEALRDADAAMYRAKERGGARVELFNPELRRAVSQRFDLERALAFAIERNEFRVVYQPIVSLEDGHLVGTEALVRWEQPQWGLLHPAEFIPAAEETGHIAAIGAFVLREALSQVMRWREGLPGSEGLWVSVNLSSRQLALADPVELSAFALREADAPPDALRLELTESAVMEDVDAAISLLRQLRLLGIKIAIDDFGTGHSSLSYLSRLPISSLKIDHSFVWALGPALEDSAIVRAIISLADTLSIEPCAEGVETEEQRQVLSELGCNLAQGFLFAAPMAPEEFEAWQRGRVAPAGVA